MISNDIIYLPKNFKFCIIVANDLGGYTNLEEKSATGLYAGFFHQGAVKPICRKNS